MLYLRYGMDRLQDGYDIEAGGGIMHIVLGQPDQGGLGYLTLLERCDCQLGHTKGFSFPGFHLDEDDRFAIFGDNINLAALAAEIPLDD